MKTFKWAIVGAGQVAHQVAAALRACRQARTVAVFSRSPDKAAAFANLFSIPNQASSIEELLADAQIDVVYIATPNHTHKNLCIEALKAGKHVLCEKPLGMTADEIQEILHVRKESDCLAMEAMWSRFIPLYGQLKEMLEQEVIGTVFAYDASMGHRIPFDTSSRFYDPKMGGGALLDLGVYPLSLALWLFGDFSDVSANVHGAPTVVEDDALVLTLHGEVSGQINVSFRRNLRNGMVIYGENGKIEVDAPLYRPYRMRLAANGENNSASGSRPSFRQRLRFNQLMFSMYDRVSRLKNRFAPSDWVTIGYKGNGYGHQIEAFHEALEQGSTTVDTMPLTHSLKVLQAIDTCKSS